MRQFGASGTDGLNTKILIRKLLNPDVWVAQPTQRVITGVISEKKRSYITDNDRNH